MKNKVKNQWRLLATLLLVFALFGCGNKCEYRVTGTAGTVDITYTNESGGKSQLDNVPLPWSYQFVGGDWFEAYISAQKPDEAGTVEVAIYRCERMFKYSESSGAYLTATASGYLIRN